MDRSRLALTVMWYGLMLIPLIFLLIFFFYPLSAILGLSLAPEGTLDIGSFLNVATSRYYRSTLWFTVWQAAVSTILTLALALPGAYVFTRYRFPGKSLLMSLATLPFVLPTVVVAAAFVALVGPRGLVNDGLQTLFDLNQPPVRLVRTLPLIFIVHVFYNYAIALRMIAGYWTNQSPHMDEAAKVLGCAGWRLWWYIRLPMLRPALFASAILVYIFTFTSFGVILILGGPRYATLEVEIYRQAISLFNLPMAAALSVVQIGTMFAMMLVYTRLQRSVQVDLHATQQIARPPRTSGERLFLGVNLGVMCILLFAPLAALVFQSFDVGDTLGWTNYTSLSTNTRQSIIFVPPIEAVRNSVFFALITTMLAVFLGTMTAYLLLMRQAGLLDPIFMLPLATSAVTLGFGFLIALDKPPLNLRASVVLIPLAHTLVAMPFVVRSVLPALRAIPPNLLEAARTLGAPPWAVWRYIELPLMSRGIVVGATFAFTISMGEFGASIFIARPRMPTMPIVIERLLSYPGTDGQALAMSVILMAVCTVSFIVIERLRTAGVGEF